MYVEIKQVSNAAPRRSSPLYLPPTLFLCPASQLNSWYLYDWANSVFSSSAVVLWLPVFMYYLAEMKACPYTWDEPVTSNTSHIHYRNQDTQLLSGNPVGDKWEGFFNE